MANTDDKKMESNKKDLQFFVSLFAYDRKKKARKIFYFYFFQTGDDPVGLATFFRKFKSNRIFFPGDVEDRRKKKSA